MVRVKNKACPECKKNNHDTDSNHLFMMADGSRWCCNKKEYHADGKFYFEDVSGNRIDNGKDGDSESVALLSAVFGFPTTVPVPPVPEPRFEPVVQKVSSSVGIVGSYRGISDSVYDKYGVTADLDSSGEPYKLYHWLKGPDGKNLRQKVRVVDPKDFYISGPLDGVNPQLFGQSVFPNAKRLLITEGEIDAMSAYQMLSKYKVAVVSLPLGANTASIMHNMQYVSSFTKGNKELYFSLDMDKQGQKTAKDLAIVFPNAKFLQLTRKDANEYLHPSDGSPPDPASFVSAFWDAEPYKPETIVRISSIIDDVLKRPVIGRPWPWPTMTAKTYGRRDGEGMFVGAGVKIGKSEFINQLLAHDCAKGWPIACIKFEEQPKETVKRVAGKLDGVMYHKPDVPYKDEDLRKTALSLHPHLFLHQAFGQARWDNVKEFIRYAVMMGCKTIIIDPITKITNGMTPSETETELRRFSDELACMAQDMGFFYIVTCHLKAPTNGPPHERGGKVETYQFRGSRAMAENCFYFVGIQRNKDPDLPEIERNTSTFVCLDDRAFGNSFKFPVYYNNIDQSYLEPANSIF